METTCEHGACCSFSMVGCFLSWVNVNICYCHQTVLYLTSVDRRNNDVDRGTRPENITHFLTWFNIIPEGRGYLAMVSYIPMYYCPYWHSISILNADNHEIISQSRDTTLTKNIEEANNIYKWNKSQYNLS